MEKDTKFSEADNNSTNFEHDIDPPRYEEAITDEFEQQRPTLSPSVTQNQSPSIASQESASYSVPTFTSINSGKDCAHFQSDFFQKPPKFLLYPTVHKNGSAEGHETDADQFADHVKRPTTDANQPTAPRMLAVPQVHQNNTDNGVLMSATQLTQFNLPLQGYITDNYLPRYSQKMICPNCKVSVFSVVQYVSGQLTHLAALAACWFTCCLACVPYFIDDLKDAEHVCPKCMTILGYNRKKLF